MPKKKEQTEEERNKMLIRLQAMRDTVKKNKEIKIASAVTTAKKEDFFAETHAIKAQIKQEETNSKLDKIASHLEELTFFKKEKIKEKKEKADMEIKRLAEEKASKPAPKVEVVSTPVNNTGIYTPAVFNNRFFTAGGGRF